MQQNIISLKTKNVPQTERKQLLDIKKRPLFKIKQFFFLSIRFSFTHNFFIFIWKSMSGHTLKAAQTVSTSQYKRTDSAKLQLKSVHKQSVKLLIFFCLFFFQCQLYTTKSPIYYYISFFKKEPHGNTPILWVQEEKIDHIRRVSEREWITHLYLFICQQFTCRFSCATFGHGRLSFIKDRKFQLTSSRVLRVLFTTVREFGDMLMRNKRKVVVLLCLAENHAL